METSGCKDICQLVVRRSQNAGRTIHSFRRDASGKRTIRLCGLRLSFLLRSLHGRAHSSSEISVIQLTQCWCRKEFGSAGLIHVGWMKQIMVRSHPIRWTGFFNSDLALAVLLTDQMLISIEHLRRCLSWRRCAHHHCIAVVQLSIGTGCAKKEADWWLNWLPEQKENRGSVQAFGTKT